MVLLTMVPGNSMKRKSKLLARRVNQMLWCPLALLLRRYDLSVASGPSPYLAGVIACLGGASLARQHTHTNTNNNGQRSLFGRYSSAVALLSKTLTLFSTAAVLFWGQTTLISSVFPPKRDCGPKRVKKGGTVPQLSRCFTL